MQSATDTAKAKLESGIISQAEYDMILASNAMYRRLSDAVDDLPISKVETSVILAPADRIEKKQVERSFGTETPSSNLGGSNSPDLAHRSEERSLIAVGEEKLEKNQMTKAEHDENLAPHNVFEHVSDVAESSVQDDGALISNTTTKEDAAEVNEKMDHDQNKVDMRTLAAALARLGKDFNYIKNHLEHSIRRQLSEEEVRVIKSVKAFVSVAFSDSTPAFRVAVRSAVVRYEAGMIPATELQELLTRKNLCHAADKAEGDKNLKESPHEKEEGMALLKEQAQMMRKLGRSDSLILGMASSTDGKKELDDFLSTIGYSAGKGRRADDGGDPRAGETEAVKTVGPSEALFDDHRDD